VSTTPERSGPATTHPPGPVLVMGTGAVGGYVGGALQVAGADVVFVGRPRMLAALRAHGLTLTDIEGRLQKISPRDLVLCEQPPAGLAPCMVLLTVKSGDTASAATALAAVLPAGTPVLSLQNGIGNAAVGQASAPALQWLSGMVPYNIAEIAPGHLHRGTSGRLAAQDDPALRALLPRFRGARLGLDLHADLRPVQWGKLLLNLNNPVNALSGLPLKPQLLDRGYRRVLADLQSEALRVLKQAGIQPAQVGHVAPRWLPHVLRLPSPIFRRLAQRMLRIDDRARSSMADDLARGRSPEIDALCGEVVRLAASVGGRAPLNAAMVGLMSAPSPARMQADALMRALRAGSAPAAAQPPSADAAQ
jgi:2-dehydropantoate 2-reductase